MRTLNVKIQKPHHFDEAANNEARHSESDTTPASPAGASASIPLTRPPRQSPAGAYRQTTPSATTGSTAGASVPSRSPARHANRPPVQTGLGDTL
ncbi:hypothetical protein Fuma_03903 [Fuerstiella marisgermanici]|uniref:Uncharacterized protein n=1 Tax=Fuerstiella marisgermanici TaxID=1891926 RepID=A0A1P8WJP2_9PLAN|nr:hypothetical protein Fuma_03903 [Fuerstiella marisgermanici]